LYPVAAAATATSTNDGIDCNNVKLANLSVPEVPIVWNEIPEKTWIRFKAHSYTYEAPRSNAKLIEEVNGGHKVAPGSRIWAGTMDGKVAWYRYERSVGSDRLRHVVASEVELF
jgi:hypothetical protein